MQDADSVDVAEISGKYHQYIVGIYQYKREVEGFEKGDDIPFDKDDIEAVRERFGLDRIKNVPDLTYNLRSRASLPEPLQKIGYSAVVQDDEAERHEAAYLLTTHPDKIQIGEPDEEHAVNPDRIPAIVREYISSDEQGTLTTVRYADVLSHFTGLECYHLQSHLRTAGRSGQVEIDDLYVGEDDEGNHYAVIVEGKGASDNLSRNQIERNTAAMRTKEEYPERVRTVAVKNIGGGSFYLVEFKVPEEASSNAKVDRCWKYTLSGTEQQSLGNFET